MDVGIEIVAHSEDKNKIKRKIMFMIFKTKAERDQVYHTLHKIVD